MRVAIIGLMAIAGIVMATPASSQDVYVGRSGVGVDLGGSYRDYDRPRYRSYEYDRPRYRSYGYERRAYRRADRTYAYGRGCRTITIEREDGSVKRIRRCG